MTDSLRFFRKMSKTKKKTVLAESIQAYGPVYVPFNNHESPSPTTSAAPVKQEDSQADVRNAVLEEELSRMRSELSRASVTCERQEMDAARADGDLHHCREELVRITAMKTETDNENRKLQADVASLERERSKLTSEVDRLKEELRRIKTKLDSKKKTVSDQKCELQRREEERERLQRVSRDKDQTWQTIRRDLAAKRDDAIREGFKIRRENEKLKSRVHKLKAEKSNILLRMWEKKQLEVPKRASYLTEKSSYELGMQDAGRPPRDEKLQAKVLSLELQLFRQARLVELLLDVIQTHDPQFSADERKDLTSAFADAGSIPELLSRKHKPFANSVTET